MATDFKKIYPYSGIEPVTIDGQKMVKIPKFYVKVGIAPEGAVQAGKKCWWISDRKRAGYHIHPAFVYKGKVMDSFYYGAYESSVEGFPNGDRWDSTGRQRVMTGYKAASIPNAHVWNYIFKEEAMTACQARNTGTDEQAGWHLHNVYEINAISILMLIEYGRTDMVNAIGTGNSGMGWTTNGNPYGDDKTVLTGKSNAVWRGIHELWGNCWEHYDGIYTDDAGKLYIFSNQMDGTYVPTGVGMPTADETFPNNGRYHYRGWMKSFSEVSGDKFDLKDVFCPSVLKGTYDGSNADGTMHDFGWWTQKNYGGSSPTANFRPQTAGYCHGSFNDSARSVGPFIWDVHNGYANAHNGFRLAKYGKVSDSETA